MIDYEFNIFLKKKLMNENFESINLLSKSSIFLLFQNPISGGFYDWKLY